MSLTKKAADVKALLARDVATLHPSHRAAFDSIKIEARVVPVESSHGETVVVVAECEGRVLYWSDIEEGWELASLTERGGIPARGSNQFELSHIMWQVFGAP